MIKYQCKICGIEFLAYPCQHRQYCSKQCKGKARTGTYKPTKKTKKKMSNSLKIAWADGRMKGNKGMPSWNKGKKYTKEQYEKIFSKELRAKKSKALKGNMYGWKGGRIKASGGYILIYNSAHPFANSKKYVCEHRLIMEQKIGRYLTPIEKVHHIDFNSSNNYIDNLHLFSNANEHSNYHKFLRNCVKETLLFK